MGDFMTCNIPASTLAKCHSDAGSSSSSSSDSSTPARTASDATSPTTTTGFGMSSVGSMGINFSVPSPDIARTWRRAQNSQNSHSPGSKDKDREEDKAVL